MRKQHFHFADLIGPVHIVCRLNRRTWAYCQVEGSEADFEHPPVIKGTSKKHKASKFYLKDKGEGRFHICYEGTKERQRDMGYLVVQRSNLPNTRINVAMSAQQYGQDDFVFELNERFPDHPQLRTLSDWPRKGAAVHISVVRGRSFYHWLPERFYIKMNGEVPNVSDQPHTVVVGRRVEPGDEATPDQPHAEDSNVPEQPYTISFVSDGNLSDPRLNFYCERASPTPTKYFNCIEFVNPDDKTKRCLNLYIHR